MERNAIKDALDGVVEKQTSYACTSAEVIDKVSLEIGEALSKLQMLVDPSSSSSSENSVILDELKTKVNNIAPPSILEGAQNDRNVALTKIQELIEKTYNTDVSKAYINVDTDTRMLNQTIANHFYREGLFDIGNCFVSEACEGMVEATRTQFEKLHHILKEMKSWNLNPALSWAVTNRENLARNGSNLELKLRRMQFVEIVRHEDQRENAFNYAMEFLTPFASTHMAELSVLMACLMWAGKLDSSPYAELLSSWNWVNLENDFTRQYCNILGQSYESPLGVTIAAGCQALPSLLKMMNAMIETDQDWQTMKQLPVPVDLDEEFQFHSSFVCPLSKDQASDENPPMMLPCTHMLLKQSIVELSENYTRPFRCPYCPTEVEVGNCRRLYF